MKIIAFVTTVALAFGLSAAETEFNDSMVIINDGEASSLYDANYSRRFIPYVKLGPELSSLSRKKSNVMPSYGVGIRSESQTSAVDCSFSYAQLELSDDHIISHYFAPKLVYLKYLNSHSPTAIFVGFGSAWTGIRNNATSQEFDGLAGVLSLGMEFGRDSRIRQIYQFDLNQPLLALRASKEWMQPILEMSFSLGF